MVLDRKNLLLLIAILESFSCIAWSLRTYGVQDLCGTSVELKSPLFGLESAAIVKPKEQGAYKEGIRKCSLMLKRPPIKSRLVVGTRRLDLRPSLQDSLTVKSMIVNRYSSEITYTSDDNKYLPDESDLTIGHDVVSITFTTESGGLNTSNYKGFELIVTVVQDAPCGIRQFQCKSKLCIAEELKCDGHNHCIDRSDQSDCFDNITTSTTGSATGSATGSNIGSTTGGTTGSTTGSTTGGTTGVTTGGAATMLHDTGLVRWLAIGGIAFLSACFY